MTQTVALVQCVAGKAATPRIIAPYDVTLHRKSAAERRAWAQRVIADLCDVTEPGDKMIFLAGLRYREYLVGPLEELGYVVEIPMVRMRFGEQLRWLNQHL